MTDASVPLHANTTVVLGILVIVDFEPPVLVRLGSEHGIYPTYKLALYI